MIEEEAIVISQKDGFAELDVIRTKPCGLCGKTQGCGNSIWGKVFSFQKRKIQIRNKINAKVGEKVAVPEISVDWHKCILDCGDVERELEQSRRSNLHI